MAPFVYIESQRLIRTLSVEENARALGFPQFKLSTSFNRPTQDGSDNTKFYDKPCRS